MVCMARRLRNQGVPLGEVFSFISGLYFRGKLAYAEKFAEVAVGLAPAGRRIKKSAGPFLRAGRKKSNASRSNYQRRSQQDSMKATPTKPYGLCFTTSPHN